MGRCIKINYSSRKSAERAAYGIKCKGSIPANAGLYPYLCKECQAYHLSRKESNEFFNGLK